MIWDYASLPLCLALAFGAVFLSSLVSMFAGRWPALMRRVAFPLLAVSGLAALGAGLLALAGPEVWRISLPLGLPWLHWQLRMDALSGFFLCVIGLVVFAAALFGPGYIQHYEHTREPLPPLGFFTGLFVAGMMLVVVADDAFMFLIAWELMSLASYFLVVYQHDLPSHRRSGFLYLLMAHVGALAILLAYGVLASFGDGFSFDAMRAADLSPLWASVAFALALVGFGAKAGLVPLHVWLPEAHPAAPAHISALMSGVMLKVAVYGFVRFTFDLLPEPQWGWGVVTLLIGAVSALLGVLYALMQHDLKRLLAYHSVENIGIIFMGLGLALIFAGEGHPVLASLGLVAGLFHTLNHAVFKCLLFFGAGAIQQHTHERDLDHMGGLLKRMPYTGLFFLVGCISISALPPFNGFASEWLTFQAALQGGVLDNGVLRIVIPAAAAMLALTSALAAACFVKVYGVAFLGQPRTRHVRHGRETTLGMRWAQGLLAALCLLLGVLPVQVIQALNAVIILLLGDEALMASPAGIWLKPLAASSASYAAPVVLGGIVAVWLLAYLMMRRRATQAVRRAPAWDCGFGPLTPRMQYTSTAFAMPIRRIFAPLWAIEERAERGMDARTLQISGLRYRLQVVDRFWGWLYAPLGHAVVAASRRVARVQTGNIRTYLVYSFVTLLLLLWLVS